MENTIKNNKKPEIKKQKSQMRISKITIGSEASINFQKSVISYEVENANTQEIELIQKEVNKKALINAKKLSDNIDNLKELKKAKLVYELSEKQQELVKSLNGDHNKTFDSHEERQDYVNSLMKESHKDHQQEKETPKNTAPWMKK